MDLQFLSNLAEIFSAAMIIVSLLFVGFQIRDANRSTRSVTFQSVQDTETRFIEFAMDHAEIWDRILTRGEFHPEERVEMRQAIMLVSFFMIDSENRYRQYMDGTLDTDSWQTRASALENIFRSHIYDKWRDSPGAFSRSPEFLKRIDEIHAAMPKEDCTAVAEVPS
jgi:hypothetical protein